MTHVSYICTHTHINARCILIAYDILQKNFHLRPPSPPFSNIYGPWYCTLETTQEIKIPSKLLPNSRSSRSSNRRATAMKRITTNSQRTAAYCVKSDAAIMLSHICILTFCVHVWLFAIGASASAVFNGANDRGGSSYGYMQHHLQVREFHKNNAHVHPASSSSYKNFYMCMLFLLRD